MMDQKRPGHTRGCQSVPNVNIRETEKIKLVRTHQKKRRRGRPRRRWLDNTREDMKKYELAADMT